MKKRKVFSVSFEELRQENEALNIEEKSKTAYFQVKYFVLAVKIKVIKITKRSRLKQPYKSEDEPSEGKFCRSVVQQLQKPFILLHFTMNFLVEFCSGITSLPTSYSGVSHYLIMSQCRERFRSLSPYASSQSRDLGGALMPDIKARPSCCNRLEILKSIVHHQK